MKIPAFVAKQQLSPYLLPHILYNSSGFTFYHIYVAFKHDRMEFLPISVSVKGCSSIRRVSCRLNNGIGKVSKAIRVI